LLNKVAASFPATEVAVGGLQPSPQRSEPLAGPVLSARGSKPFVYAVFPDGTIAERCLGLVPVHLGQGEEFVGEVLGAGFGEKVMRLSGRLLERHPSAGLHVICG
jgi:hypothetical protein